jgi:glycosyltransferase involved in cell wall biosynthesis
MGLSAAEEMAAGLPVIATDTGGYRDFIVSGENGFLVPPKDVPSLGAVITKMVGDADLRRRLSARALTTSAMFDEGKVLGDLAQVIDRLTT